MKEDINNAIEQIKEELKNGRWNGKEHVNNLEARLERLEQLYEDLYGYI